jgi:hypothetical protein
MVNAAALATIFTSLITASYDPVLILPTIFTSNVGYHLPLPQPHEQDLLPRCSWGKLSAPFPSSFP